MEKSIYGIALLCLFFFATSCKVQSPLEKQGVKFIEGSDLFYEVTAQGMKYNFDININGFTNTYVSFDWNLADSKNGTVFVHEEAMLESFALKNYFQGGYKALKDRTSVWVSKKLFKEIKSGKTLSIDLDNNEVVEMKMKGTETYSFGDQGGGVPFNVPVIVVGNDDDSRTIWIMDDPNNRLIVMMDIAFRIDLLNVKQ